MTRRYTHNARGELVADTVRFGSTVLRAVRHDRDALGRVTGTTESVGASSVAWRYHYDASGALDSVWRNGALSSWWGYDSNGVRVSGSGVTGVTHDAADRVLSQNGVTFTYDANGRLVSRRAGVSETRYVYDLRGGLRAVDLPSGDRITYGVDASGRRISRSVNGAVTHRWLWEGNLRPVGEVDSTGRVLARYVYGTRANVPDAIVRHDTLYRVITDERGSVRMGARDYAPELGRWTATDPIGFEGGDANLYGYVGNDPVNYVDPTGLSTCGATGGADSASSNDPVDQDADEPSCFIQCMVDFPFIEGALAMTPLGLLNLKTPSEWRKGGKGSSKWTTLDRRLGMQPVGGATEYRGTAGRGKPVGRAGTAAAALTAFGAGYLTGAAIDCAAQCIDGEAR